MRPLKSARVGTLSKPNANNYHARYCKREKQGRLAGSFDVGAIDFRRLVESSIEG